jgi:predicted nucleic acid-binding protein
MKPVKLVYLDTNLYCRPLDDQNDRRIFTEAKAVLEIVGAIEAGKIAVVSSDYVKFEIEQIVNAKKRKDIRSFERALCTTSMKSSRKLIALAQDLVAYCRLGSLDALHVASACLGGAQYLLTCDDQVIDRTFCIEKLAKKEGYNIKVRNPVMYLQESEESLGK